MSKVIKPNFKKSIFMGREKEGVSFEKTSPQIFRFKNITIYNLFLRNPKPVACFFFYFLFTELK